MGHSVRTIFEKLTLLLFIGPIICLLLGGMGSIHWVFDGFSNFRFQYIVVLSFTALLFILLKKQKLFFINLLIVVFLLLTISKYFIPYKAQPENPIKIASINLMTINRQFNLVKELIKEEQPDVILFMEYNHDWDANLSSIQSSYPYIRKEARSGHFGIAMYSKIPYQKATIFQAKATTIPSIKADLLLNGKPFTLIGMHPPPPIDERHFKWRNQQMVSINKMILSNEAPLAVMGDFNCTNYSPNFRKLTKGSGLVDSRMGKGLQSSWHFGSKITLVPIDHFLASEELKIKSRFLGSNIGSDHLPLFVEVGW